MAGAPPVTDAQVHAYECDHHGRPWTGEPAPPWAPGGHHGPAEVTGSDLVRAMDETGVAAAVLVSPWIVYRYDASYALRTAREHPDRFRVVAPIDPLEPSVVRTVDRLAADPYLVGLRLVLADPAVLAAAVEGRLAAFFGAAARHDLPVALLAHDLAAIGRIAEAHRGNRFLVDHLGLRQPLTGPPPAEPFAALPGLLRLARYDNIIVKVSGVPTLTSLPFPYADLWPYLDQVFAAFGLDRCAWGSDWTRALDYLTYRDGVDYLRRSDRLTADEKTQLMGGTIRRVYAWPEVTATG